MSMDDLRGVAVALLLFGMVVTVTRGPAWLAVVAAVPALVVIVKDTFDHYEGTGVMQRWPWLIWVVVIIQVYAATWAVRQDFAAWKKVFVVSATTTFVLGMILKGVKRQRQP